MSMYDHTGPTYEPEYAEPETTGDLVDHAIGLAEGLNEVIRDLESQGVTVTIAQTPGMGRDRIKLSMTFGTPR